MPTIWSHSYMTQKLINNINEENKRAKNYDLLIINKSNKLIKEIIRNSLIKCI